MNYRYSLEKYTDNNSRHICPRCGMKEFSKYIENATGNYLGIDYGRCNRENKCGYHKPPAGLNTYNSPLRQFKSKESQKKVFSAVPRELFKISLNDCLNNNFCLGLKNIFDNSVINQLAQRFHLGALHKNVIFWQIDQDYKIHAGKIMKYNPETISREGIPGWVHRYYKLEGFQLDQCLFGLHQINSCKSSIPICIVESEKTAIIMSGYFTKIIWLATGGINNLSMERLRPLIGYNIYLYPDLSAENKWAIKIAGFPNIKIVDWSRSLRINLELEAGSDPADFRDRIYQVPLPSIN